MGTSPFVSLNLRPIHDHSRFQRKIFLDMYRKLQYTDYTLRYDDAAHIPHGFMDRVLS